ncbi:MAG: lipopolysaccharide biosynthesis protein [Rhodoglobus sp.]
MLILAPQYYAAWALVFSIGTFVVYLDLGIPTTVQAMVGRAESSGDMKRASLVTRSGLKIVSLVSLGCLVLGATAAVFFSTLFPAVPTTVILEAQVALVLVLLGQTATLVGNTASAYFAGQQRSIVPAIILAPTRVVSMLAALILAAVTSDLIWTSVGFAAPLIAGSCVLIVRFVRDARPTDQTPPRDLGNTSPLSEYGALALLRYSGPLMVWGFCVLLITGTGTILVARFDYASIVPFSIATVVVSALAGLSSAATAPLLPELARVHELQGIDHVTRQVRTLSALSSSILFTTTALLLAAAPWYLPLLDRRLVEDSLGASWWILAVLLVGNTVQLSGTPMSLAFIATKTHTRVLFPPVIQAVVSFALSVALGSSFGAVGVATGVLVGAILGILMMFTWSVKLTRVFEMKALDMVATTVLIPLSKIVPVLLVAGAVATLGLQHSWWAAPSVAIAVAITVGAMWQGIPAAWRRRVLQIGSSRLGKVPRQ